MLRICLAVGSTLLMGALVCLGRGAGAHSSRPGALPIPSASAASVEKASDAGPAARSVAAPPPPISPLVLARAFDELVDVEPMGKPGPNDWLANHAEPGQTFDEWRECARNEPDAERAAIRLMPLGALGVDFAPSIDVLASYAGAFFAMPARPIPAPDKAPTFTERIDHGHRQILSTGVLRWLRGKLPPDAFCAIALTTIDLYPDPSWNFVFGQASFVDRTGVFSFARYDPRFYGVIPDTDTASLVLRRSLKVMSHEIGHMFGMEHCIRFRCLMNGSNHLSETDGAPMDLCPVCLRKLQHAVGFDPLVRERALESWRRTHGLVAEADRSAARIARWSR